MGRDLDLDLDLDLGADLKAHRTPGGEHALTLQIGWPCHMKCAPDSSTGLSHRSPQAVPAPGGVEPRPVGRAGHPRCSPQPRPHVLIVDTVGML